ncbi:MAG: MBL fold metallo-hydrolase [Desulfitobacteriaceae bacterium]
MLTDPFNEKVGYPLPHVKVDFVTVSHQHYDHSSVHVLDRTHKEPVIIQKLGIHRFDEADLEIRGIVSFHDTENGAKRGPNTIFVIKADGLRIAHLGDLGHLLSQEQIAEMGPLDILCIPVGGVYTIDAQVAQKVIAQLQPLLVLPMHYNYLPYVQLPIAPIDEFKYLYPDAEEIDSLNVDGDSLPKRTRVKILKHTA